MSELPQGWSEAKLNDLLEYVTSGSRDWSKYYAEKGALFVRTQDINKNKLSAFYSIAKVSLPERVEGKRTLIKKDDILLTITGANVGKCAHIERDIPEAYVSQSVALVRLIDKSLAKFVHKQLISPSDGSVQTKLEASAYGMGRPVLNLDNVREVSLNIAPHAEQARITQKIDELLAQVDTLKSRIDAIPALLKLFRQSVLASAVSGRLTENWRLSNGLTKLVEKHWESTNFGAICSEITVGYVGKMADQYTETGIPFLRSQNVRPFRFSKKNLLYVSKDFHERIIKSKLSPGDLAIVRSGAPGVTCVIPDELEVANCSDLVIARPSERLNPHFGCLFMNSEVAQKNVAENQVGVAQQHFNVGSMKKMPIELPPIEEQLEIVRRTDQLFAFADQLESKVQTAKARIDLLSQSILAKAFRGELVPQDPNDEPASVLLERIRAQRTELPKARRGRKSAATN
ncbi:restriction endonuclease subunit S [Pseudomonas sediminis]|uniref:Restriction endonuclease subunit S n=1 Tax=Pseudomonas sediminis TaxID=1691904 RepID=A0ABX6SHX4_9PSED|nr:restriction endonuclease subunit S [Pseudomonas sediminis]QNH01187.1 restriction endonuclease subunit S [Pseudomonas sediminis]